MQNPDAVQFLVIGKKGAGKSQLISSLAGRGPGGGNTRDSAASSRSHAGGGFALVETPGIVFDSDGKTPRIAVSSMRDCDSVLLVVRATSADEDLECLLPLVGNKRGAIVVTNLDRTSSKNAAAALGRLERDLRMPAIAVDARSVSESQRGAILDALENPRTFPSRTPRTGISVRPRPAILEKRHAGVAIGMLLLLSPSILSVVGANYFAGLIHPATEDLLREPIEALKALPSPLADILAGDYGLVSMGPFLFVWAAPVVVMYALLLGVYKSSGLLDRTSLAIHPLVKKVGISGKDVTRIVMGFGCNVPAVIGSRSCSSCSRGATVSAIGFGSACSYQFGASIAVFSAAGMPWLVVPFLLYLAGTAVVYTRLVSAKGRPGPGMPVIEGQALLARPALGSVWRESGRSIAQFLRTAPPIFLAIALAVSVASWTGLVDILAAALGPAMGLFNLPGESSLAVILGSIRKDGLLLLAEPGVLDSLSAVQVLTGVYLAGALLPCAVTLLTIIREMSWTFAVKMAARQAAAAVAFAMLLAHSEGILRIFQA